MIRSLEDEILMAIRSIGPQTTDELCAAMAASRRRVLTALYALDAENEVETVWRVTPKQNPREVISDGNKSQDQTTQLRR